MSRPHNQRILGAYPLLEEWRPLLSGLFAPLGNKQTTRVLDPFFNTGESVLTLARRLSSNGGLAEVYGSEIQDDFIETARNNAAEYYKSIGIHPEVVLARVLHDDAFYTTITNNAFGLVYCNPPYDDMVEHDDGSIEKLPEDQIKLTRVEFTALQRYFRYVADGGYMAFVCYAHHISENIYREFRRNCNQYAIFRFPHPHLKTYTQIVIIGRRVKGHKNDDATYDAGWAAWQSLKAEPNKIPPLDLVNDAIQKRGTLPIGVMQFPLQVPPAVGEKLIQFEGNRTDIKALTELVARRGVHNTTAALEIAKPPQEPPPLRPLHAPNRNQMALYIAGGMLDGIEINRNGQVMWLRGSTKPVDETVDEDEQVVQLQEKTVKRTKTVILTRPSYSVTLLGSDGKIEQISDAENLNKLVKDNAALLLEAYEKRYKPFYDVTLHTVWRKVLMRVGPPGGAWFKEQALATAATVEHTAVNRKTIMNVEQRGGKTLMSSAADVCLRVLYECIHNPDNSPLLKHFDITREDVDDLIINRFNKHYQVKTSELSTLPPDKPIIVTVPPIAIPTWLEKVSPMFPGFVVRLISNTTDARRFMELATANTDPCKVWMGIVSYSTAKTNEGREPAAWMKRNYKRAFEYVDGVRYEQVKTTISARDSITGEPMVVSDNGAISEVPAKRFTYEGRSKQLYQWVGRDFYGYKPERVHDAQAGQHILKINREKGNRLFSTVVNRPLTKDEIADNESAGYPRWRCAYYPMYSDVRRLTKDQEDGLQEGKNGRANTPFKEIIIEPRVRKETRYMMGGIRIPPKIDEITVPAQSYAMRVPDWSKQKSLIDQPIYDSWIASKGIRIIEDARNSKIDKLMRKYAKTEYWLGEGVEELDAVLKARGIGRYEVAAGPTNKSVKYPVARYLRRFWKGSIGMYHADELHKAKSAISDIGNAFRQLAVAADMTIGLTGTVIGGKASSVFTIEYVFNDWVRKHYLWDRGQNIQWIKDMGAQKHTVVSDRIVVGNSITSGAAQTRETTPTEANGISPKLVILIASHTIFLTLKDFSGALPQRIEDAFDIPMSDEMLGWYSVVDQELDKYNRDLLAQLDTSFMGACYQSMISLSEAYFREQPVIHRKTLDKQAARKSKDTVQEKVVTVVPPLPISISTKEEQTLADLEELLTEERRVIVLLLQTATRDIQPHWYDLIKTHVPSAKPFIIRSGAGRAQDRLDLIRDQVKAGGNVLICNPALIEVGIDLAPMFSAIQVIEFDQSYYRFAQAIARINGPAQLRNEIKIRYYYYGDNAYQQRSISNIAEKVAVNAMLRGDEMGDLEAAMGADSRVAGSHQHFMKQLKEGLIAAKTQSEINESFGKATALIDDHEHSSWYAPNVEWDQSAVTAYRINIEKEAVQEEEPEEELELEVL